MTIFDTDVISFLMKNSPDTSLIRRLAAVSPIEQATTSISASELIYGAWRSPRRDFLLARLDELVWPNLLVLPFDHHAAAMHGELRATLEAHGTPIAEPDLRIASICLSRGAALATGNARHFRRIPGLTVEDWLAEAR